MTTLGGLKSNRTRYKNSFMNVQPEIVEFLRCRQDIQTYAVEGLGFKLDEFNIAIPSFEEKLGKYEAAQTKLHQHYQANPADGTDEQKQELDTDSHDLIDCKKQLQQLKVFHQRMERNYDRMMNVQHAQGLPPKAEDGQLPMVELMQQMALTLERLTQPVAPQPPPHAAPAATSVKLPKYDLPTFDGDIMQWNGFWDEFNTSVHTSTTLALIEKHKYLRMKCEGAAHQSISGLQLTGDNYQVAVDILTERFGKNQPIVDAHYTALEDMAPVGNSTAAIRLFFDTLEQHLRSLTSLGENVENKMMVTCIKRKLSHDILTQIERLKPHDQPWTMARLRQFLRQDLQLRESLIPVDTQKADNSFKGSGARSKTTYSPDKSKPLHSSGQALVVKEQNKKAKNPCSFCQKMHFTDECRTFSTMEARNQKAKELGLCFICFRKGHSMNDCKSSYPCFHCAAKGKHHRALCPKKFGSKPKEKSPSKPLPTEHNNLSISGETETGLLANDESVIMQTALTMIGNPKSSTTLKTRLLFDCGSNRTYVAKRLAILLGLKFGKKVLISMVTFGSDKIQVTEAYTTTLTILLRDGSTMTIFAHIVDIVSGETHRVPYGTQFPSYLMKDYAMADTFPTQVETSTIELLIGQDYYFDLTLPERVEVRPGLHLLGSKLGWILAGRISGCSQNVPNTNLFVHSYNTLSETELAFIAQDDPSSSVDPNMEDFWKLETIGIEPPSQMSDEDIAVQQFNDTVKVENNRYHVGWPWKSKDPNLPTNYALAYNRFRSTAKKFEARPDLLKKYDDVIQNQVKLGIIEEVTATTPEGPLKHYVPHQPVETPSKTTTKVRVVYDASAKSRKENLSLNDCLYPGPVLLQDLCGLLLRFRLPMIAVVADIEKAFLNIGLQNNDRDVTRFFWFKDPTNPTLNHNVIIYRFCRIPFGVNSSPFLLAATLNHLLETWNSPISLKIKDDIYVDNVITGTPDIASALQLYDESQQIFSSVSLNLREWSSNSEEFLDKIPPHHRAEGCFFKVLGLAWNTKDDCLNITGFDKEKFKSVSTKRQVLQAIASVYDPLGYFAPVTLLARLFLHSLWIDKLDWDHKLPPDKLIQWSDLYDQLHAIAAYSIPRFIGYSPESGATFMLLCFCDASADSFATTVYLRSILNSVHAVNLTFSKTRLSPKPKFSIPRLELMAALIGVRSLNFVEKHLHLPIQAKILWSDSQCVLHWIRSTKPLSVFIENRVREIRQSEDISFRYVKTTSNPADMATRGRTVIELQDSIWWHGPAWLKQEESKWPTWDVEQFDQSTLDAIEAETRKSKVMFEVGLVVGEGPTERDMITPFGIKRQDYSSFVKLIRVTALCLRFIKILTNRRLCMHNQLLLSSLNNNFGTTSAASAQLISSTLTLEEISKAKLLWELTLQRHWYPEVLQAINDGTKNSLCDQLGLRIDDSGLLRCYGRFENAILTEAARKPKLLPGKDHFTKLIIESIHKTSMHSGVSGTLSSLRQEYWIPQGRSRVRSVLKDCHICRRVMGGPFKLPVMAPWPKEKMSQAPAFSVTGLDYFGPLYIKDNSSATPVKVWVCLFTCVATRAIHLELIHDMSSEQFLMCFRRFIAHYGKPEQLISDNATQFKLAKSTLDKAWLNVLHDEDTQTYVANQGIKWKFIVQFAPWTGGFYERMVGIVKSSLKKTIGKLCLDLCQMSTLLIEVQAVVNSRPLVYVTDDINSDITLTPAHFLRLNPRIGVPELLPNVDEDDPDFSTQSISSAQALLLTWKKGQQHLQRFWKIWKDTYLLSLRERTQHHVAQGRIRSSNIPKSGDVVLIHDNLPRGTWKLGKIQSLIASQDGQYRAATVLLPSKKTLNRPINLLYPIECPAAVEPISGNNDPETIVTDIPTVDNDPVGTPTDDTTQTRPRRTAAVRGRETVRQWVREMVGLQFTTLRHDVLESPGP